MANLFDLIPKESRAKLEEAYQKRMAGDLSFRKDLKFSPHVYLIAEAGVYFGWGVIQDIKRGYTSGVDEDGKLIKIPLTFEELTMLVEAARKVRFSGSIDRSRAAEITRNGNKR